MSIRISPCVRCNFAHTRNLVRRTLANRYNTVNLREKGGAAAYGHTAL